MLLKLRTELHFDLAVAGDFLTEMKIGFNCSRGMNGYVTEGPLRYREHEPHCIFQNYISSGATLTYSDRMIIRRRICFNISYNEYPVTAHSEEKSLYMAKLLTQMHKQWLC